MEPKKFAENDFNALSQLEYFMTTPNQPQIKLIGFGKMSISGGMTGLQVRREFCEKYACRKSGIMQRFAGVLKEAL